MSKSNVVLLDAHRSALPKERLFIVTLHRASQQASDKGKRLTRRYVVLENAMSCITKWAMWEGRPKDVFVVHHDRTGTELGTVQVKATGHLVSKWIFEE